MLLEKFFFLYKHWPFKNDEKKNAIMIAPMEECLAPPGAVYMPSWLMATPARPLQIITPTYPAANATFNSSHSTLSVMTKEIEVAHALMQSITEGKGSVSQLFDPADFFKSFSNFVELKVSALVAYIHI